LEHPDRRHGDAPTQHTLALPESDAFAAEVAQFIRTVRTR